jgi:hypothetical protein
MDRELIERLARENSNDTVDNRGRVHYDFDIYGLERFAALVAEECAKIADASAKAPGHWGFGREASLRCAQDRSARQSVAAAIRGAFKAP